MLKASKNTCAVILGVTVVCMQIIFTSDRVTQPVRSGRVYQ